MGEGLLARSSPVLLWRRLRQLHDGRRGAGPRAQHVRRQLSAAGGYETAVRPGQRLPHQSEHPSAMMAVGAGCPGSESQEGGEDQFLRPPRRRARSRGTVLEMFFPDGISFDRRRSAESVSCEVPVPASQHLSAKEAPVSQKILQINYKIGIPAADFSRAMLAVAQPIADSPGLLWKIWLMNEADSEAGGIYLFENEAAVNAFLDGPIVRAFKANAIVSDIRVKMFDVSEAHSLVTNAPIGRGVAA